MAATNSRLLYDRTEVERPLFEGSMLYARPQAKGKQRRAKTIQQYFFLTKHQLEFREHQKGASESKPTCVATVSSMRRLDFVSFQRKQGNGTEAGHHARLITVQEGGQRNQLHFWTKTSGELQSFIAALKKATEGQIEIAYVRPSRMVPLKGFTVISTENRLAPLPGDLPLELSQTAIIHDTEPLPSNKIWRGTISSGDHGLVDPECIEILDIKLEPWFFEGVSRESAETLLNGQPHGSFIVRTTEDEPNQIKLTVRPEGQICHYKILEKDGKFRLTKNGEACNSVSELINFYKSKPIEGLCPSTVLKFYPSRANKFSLEEWDIHPSEVFYDLGEESVKITQQSKFVLGSWRDNQKVLIEILKERLQTKEDIARFENRIELHSSLKHDRIVRLLGICWTHEPTIIITEFPNKGDLASYVQNSTVDLKSRWMLLSHICSAMEYLEDLGVVHNDLTSENCLVSTDPEEVAKVAGLHYAVRKSGAKSGSWFGNEDPTNKSDVYCFGVIMYEIGTSFKQPFNKQKMTPGSGYCPPFPRQSISDEQQSMIKECWKRKKDERPLFAQLFIKMRSLGLCKNESYYSEIKGYLRESTQEGVEEKERVEYVTTGLDPERRNRPSLPIVETVSGELEGSIGYVETPRSPGPPLPSDTQSAKRQELSSDTTIPTIHRTASEVIKPSVDHERLRKSGSGPAFFVSQTDSSSEYIEFMARHVIPEEEEKKTKLIQELRFQLDQAERDKDKLKKEVDRVAKENGHMKEILKLKLVECRNLTKEKLDWEEYKDFEKPLPLNFQPKQMSSLYSDHPFEPTFLSFTVTHRGGTYVSAAMNVAISVPRGTIGRNKSVTLSCKYFSGDQEKLGLDASAIVVSSIYELSSSDCITAFEKRVQISLPHGIVLQRLGEKFQMKAIVSQTDTGNPEGLCWDPVPSRFCTFSSESCIVRVQHFSLLTLIIETVQAGVEFFKRSWQSSDESASNELPSRDSREINKMYPPDASLPQHGIYRRYHVALYGETSTNKEGDYYVQNLFFYCYYGIPKNRKEIREQERELHNEMLGLDIISDIDIDTYSQVVSVKSVASSDQISFDPHCQVIDPTMMLHPGSCPLPIKITATLKSDADLEGWRVRPSKHWCKYDSGQITLTFNLENVSEYSPAVFDQPQQSVTQSPSSPVQDFNIVGASGLVVVGSSPTLILQQTIYQPGVHEPSSSAGRGQIGSTTEDLESDLLPIPLSLAKELSGVLDIMLEQRDDWRSLASNLGLSSYTIQQLEKMAVSAYKAVQRVPSPTMTVLRHWIQMVGQSGVSITSLYKAVQAIDPPCTRALKCFERYRIHAFD